MLADTGEDQIGRNRCGLVKADLASFALDVVFAGKGKPDKDLHRRLGYNAAASVGKNKVLFFTRVVTFVKIVFETNFVFFKSFSVIREYYGLFYIIIFCFNRLSFLAFTNNSKNLCPFDIGER